MTFTSAVKVLKDTDQELLFSVDKTNGNPVFLLFRRDPNHVSMYSNFTKLDLLEAIQLMRKKIEEFDA